VATVPATKFKAQCLELMDRVAEGRETYVITKRGKPVAKLVPVDRPRKKSIFGCMADQTEIVGDIESPPTRVEQLSVSDGHGGSLGEGGGPAARSREEDQASRLTREAARLQDGSGKGR
jgi:prevent-host-death family protein